jgi:hypothetical protein
VRLEDLRSEGAVFFADANLYAESESEVRHGAPSIIRAELTLNARTLKMGTNQLSLCPVADYL